MKKNTRMKSKNKKFELKERKKGVIFVDTNKYFILKVVHNLHSSFKHHLKDCQCLV